MSSLIENLRSLARFEHADLSVADEAADEIERLRAALHRISLASQNSMCSKEDCGREARKALEPK